LPCALGSDNRSIVTASQHAAGSRSWNLDLLSAAEPGRRNRRTIDGVLLAIGALVVGLTAVIADTAPTRDEDVAHAFVTVFGWARAPWEVALVSAVALALAIVAEVLFRRRWELARDLAVAVLVVVGLANALGRLVVDDWLPVEGDLFSDWGFPELRVASVVAVLTVAGPELARPVRKLAGWLVPFAALGTVALGAALPSAALAGLALGLGAGALVRLAFGSAAGVPPVERVRAAVAALGLDVSDLTAAERQRVGFAEFVARDADGSPLNVRVLGQDAQDTQWIARRWRLLAYRDPPQSAPVGRLEQVEHEAVATLMAARAGVRVPQVVTVGLGPDGDAVLVTRQPDVDPLELLSAGDVSDELLEDLGLQVERLHRAGISHGRLNASNVLVEDGQAMLVDLSAATVGAPQSSLDIDVAELLVACTVLVGPERALGWAVAGGHTEALTRVLPYLQPAALTPHLRDLAREHEVALKDLRVAIAEATGTEPPAIAPLRRVRPRDLLATAALIVGAYLLITQLAEIGFSTIADELRGAEVAWVVVALLLAQATFIPSGISVRGGVRTPLPLLPCVVLQSAIKFINLTVPSSAGRIGMNLRCLQRMGAPRSEAVVGGAVDDISNTIVQLALLLLALAFVRVNVDADQFKAAGPDRRLLIGIGIALLASVVVLLAVPKVRTKLMPGVRSALSGLRSVARDRHKRLELFGGTLASELLYALSLGATCLAYGINLNVGQLVFVNTSASLLSSVIPAPGGIGAAEAALSAGLIALGVGESTALAIAVTQRLCTFYLPPIWGYLSLRWLERKGYV
jgi:glycosyltransferase 2 family protein